jgi:hypothetical protein
VAIYSRYPVGILINTLVDGNFMLVCDFSVKITVLSENYFKQINTLYGKNSYVLNTEAVDV